jgi:hypothetical protein
VRSPRMRWPRESWRTGVSRKGPRSSSSVNAATFGPVPVGGDLVDVAEEVERVAQREVPPQLRALPKTTPILRVSSMRRRAGSSPGHPDGAARGARGCR